MKNPYIASQRDGKPQLTCVQCGITFTSEQSNVDDAAADVLKKYTQHNCLSKKNNREESRDSE